jgi:DMSO/TMAO reductase YedYZ heme-binding membrane subunit
METMEEKKIEEPQKPKLFSGAMKNKTFVIKFLIFSLGFWLLQYTFQIYVATPTDSALAIVRSLGFAAATFYGFALFSSALFKWMPQYAKYWYVRRSFGVTGTIFLIFHVWTAVNLLGGGDISVFLTSLNPLENPVIFGFIAYPIFFVMMLTSTDWIQAKLGYNKWKPIHRLVYFGYMAAVFHFMAINPAALANIAGYFLMLITALALLGELYWFIQTVRKGRSSRLGIAVGVLVILLWLTGIYLIYL